MWTAIQWTDHCGGLLTCVVGVHKSLPRSVLVSIVNIIYSFSIILIIGYTCIIDLVDFTLFKFYIFIHHSIWIYIFL